MLICISFKVHVHQAARLLLDAQLGRMLDSDLLALLDKELGQCMCSLAAGRHLLNRFVQYLSIRQNQRERINLV